MAVIGGSEKPHKLKRRLPSNISEFKENSRLAKEAVEKPTRGEAITEDDLVAIYKSDALLPNEQNAVLNNIPNLEELQFLLQEPQLYVEQPEIVHGYLDFWVPNLEREMLAYFRANPEQLYSMAPRRFEELIAAIFKNNGFSVELTPQTRDGGVDIIAVQHSALTGETVNLVECKRYSPTRKVGIGVVQRLLGCVHERRATKGILVTTSFFSQDAQHVARNSKHVLALNAYNAVTGWLTDLVKG